MRRPDYKILVAVSLHVLRQVNLTWVFFRHGASAPTINPLGATKAGPMCGLAPPLLSGYCSGAALRDIVFSWREDNYMGK